jgi:putative ABC transport system substrate-binding protein
LNAEVGPKRLELLHELVPTANVVGLLVNPTNPNLAEPTTKNLHAAARTLGLQLHVLHASTERDFEAALAMLVRNKADALMVGADSLFFNRRLQLVTLATRHAIPAVYFVRDFAEAGGLMSYGTSLPEVYRQLGVYTGRILKGEKPAELPVVQSTKFELVINLITAKALGLDVPPTLLARADEVIE